MAILAISVESNGWVLAVRGNWGATAGAWTFGGSDRTDGVFASAGVDQFPLTPNGIAKMTLAVRDSGFDRIGGQAQANASRPRTIVATKALRRPFPNQTQLDETDNGDGTRTVRLALSDRVYGTSTVVSCGFLAGWKVGETGGTLSSVTNNSTISAPVPLFRWALPPWPLVQGTSGSPNHIVPVELVIGSHHPESPDSSNRHQPCAAVKLTAYDGTNSKTLWISAPSTSPRADGLRCWRADFDLSGAGLTAGPVTIHAEVFPWIGPSRATGTAHSTSPTAFLTTAWGTPYHVAYDPTGTRYVKKYAYLDTSSTNTDGFNSTHLANIQLYTTRAAAKAASVTAKAANISALFKKYESEATKAAANGFASITRAIDYYEVFLTAGQTHTAAHNVGTSTGARTGEGFLIIQGDPDDADPRANCTFSSTTTSYTCGNVTRLWFKNLTMLQGNNPIFGTISNSVVYYENCNIASRSGESASGQGVYNSATNNFMLDCASRNLNTQPSGHLMRNCTRTGPATSSNVHTAINVTVNTPAGGDYAPVRSGNAFGSSLSSPNDLVIWGCKVFQWDGGPLVAIGGIYGQDTSSYRFLVVNTLIEGQGGKIIAIGETANSQLRDSLFDGVTLVGGRFNWHNDADPFSNSTFNTAVRYNNGATITLGSLGHGLTTGDTITTSGWSIAAMNVTNAVVTVLDANRFSYTASASVTTAPSVALGQYTPTASANSAIVGVTRTILRENISHTGNIMRNCSLDRNGTKHDLFDNQPHFIGSWELLYGVGFRSNVIANRTTSSPGDFQYAWPGLGCVVETNFTANGTSNPATDIASAAVNWHGYVDDNSNFGPDYPTATYNGDYRPDSATVAPFKPSRLIGKGVIATTDRTQDGQARGATFPTGAFGAVAVAPPVSRLQVDGAVHPQAASASAVRWFGRIAVASALHGTSGTPGRVQPVPSGFLTGDLRTSYVEAEVRQISAEDL